MHCGICAQNHEQLLCASCCSFLFLHSRVTLYKALEQLAELKGQVSASIAPRCGQAEPSGNAACVAQLQASARRLTSLASRQSRAAAALRSETQATVATAEAQAAHHAERDAHTEALTAEAAEQYTVLEETRRAREGLLQSRYREMLLETMELQSRVFADFLEVFNLKKKRKKDGFEIVLNQVVIPDLYSLGHYSTAVINSGLERVGYFVELLARYTSQDLPYPLVLPSAAQPKLLIGHEQEPLWLPHSVRTMTRSSPRDFYRFCRLLSMQYLNVVYMALRLGAVEIRTFEDMSKLGHVLTQIYLRIDACMKQGVHMQLVSASADKDVDLDLDGLQEYLITTIDVALNGRSAEWNLVEAPPTS